MKRRRRTQDPDFDANEGRDDERGPGGSEPPETDEARTERLQRRAAFLRELQEAKELRARVRPRRTRLARLRQAIRQTTYRHS